MVNIETKICLECKEEKPITEFGRHKSYKDGYEIRCKKCHNKLQKEYLNSHQEEHKKRTKKYYDNCDKELKKKKHKEWREKTEYTKSDKFKNQVRKFANTEKGKKYYRKYNKEYAKTEKGKKIYKDYRIWKLKNDLSFKIAVILRGRLRDGLKAQNARKTMRALDLIGCDFVFFRSYMESLFTDGMSWNNYGFYGWHIDHIRPCASFDLSDPEQQKQCFHYTNLQPLWAKDNLSKGSKQVA